MKWTGISSFIIERHGRRRSSRGFTLTEVAVVLGVGAIIIGGVWAVAGQSWENSRQTALKTDISIVVKNVRALYVGQNGISGALAPLTLKLAQLSPPAMPGDMMRAAAVGGCGIAVCVDHPWGATTAATGLNGSFGVCAWDPSTSPPGCTAGSTQFFAVELDALPLASCIKAATLDFGSDAPQGLYDVVINGTSIINGAAVTHQLPVVPSNAQALCTASSTLDFVYRVVTPQS